MINAIRAFAPLREKIGKPRLRTTLIVLTAAVLPLLLASCIEPSPLYGSWADNMGNTFSFFDNGKFNARVSTAASAENYGGNYTILLNTLTLDCKGINLRIVTEWDIRGNILYLDWITADKTAMSLSLFKISN